MADNLPIPTPEKSGNNKSATNQTGDKRDAKPEKEIRPRRRRTRRFLGLSGAKFREFAGYFILIGWLWYDLIDSHGTVVKLCFLAASLTVAQGLACSFFKSWRKAITAWVIAEVLVAAVVWANSRPEPEPSFTVSLQYADSSGYVWPPILLTNENLFKAGMAGEGVYRKTNGFVLFNGVPATCVVVPVLSGETNKIFRFSVENDSPFHVSDLEVIVGLPIDNKIGLDTSKWLSIERLHWFIPGWKMHVTNMQFWAFSVPWNMSFGDTAGLPTMTNFSIPSVYNPTNRNSNFELILRSGRYQEIMSANVLFWHVSTNEVFAPFLANMKQEENGAWRISVETNDFKKVPK